MKRFRRPIWITAALLSLGLAVLFSPSTQPVQAAQRKPNIVFILSDDLDNRTSPYWERATSQGLDDPLKKTKALINDKGLVFDNAFAPTPICCPARSTILTGKLGHNTGVLTNGGDQGGWGTFVKNGNEAKTIAVYLQNAGYRTGLIGKYLNGIDTQPTFVPAGWTEWYGFIGPRLQEYMGYGYGVNENGTVRQYGWQPDDYSTDYVARHAVDFIQRAETNDDQPFFLYVAPTAPHLPLPPAPRHNHHPYENANPPQMPNYLEGDLSDKSAWLRLTGPQRLAVAGTWNPVDYRNRQGSLYALDDLVEGVVKALDAAGELDNTYIIFTSDNGYNMGAHRLIHKMAPYEESIRIPFSVRGPGIAAGQRRSQMTLESDFAPTFLQWAGLAEPSDMDGRPLQPAIASATTAGWRSDFLIQYVTAGGANGIGAELPPAFFVALGQEIPTYRAVRNGRYMFVEWYDEANANTFGLHQYELYDLAGDPWELNNLIAGPIGQFKYRTLTSQLMNRMDQLEACAGEDCR